MSDLALTFARSIKEVDPAQWDALGDQQPFLRHAFLLALEQSQAIGGRSGWVPNYPLLHRDGVLVASMPLYFKQHSYGEYVFDWAWADAYQRAGLRYYPKLLAAIPFTPVGGQRLLAATPSDAEALLLGVLQFAQDQAVSSLHCLFPAATDAAQMRAAGMLCRHGVQFHWRNASYRDFDDFLDSLTRDKRKKIRQERRRVADAGVRVERKVGTAISAEDWVFFDQCYQRTYREHRSTPYLNLDFFQAIGTSLPDACVLALAYQNDQPIAAALHLADLPNAADAPHQVRRLYGRYWGAMVYVPNLHFELCYYQGIEHAITHNFAVFEGGAQGEHKLARGLLPVATESWHWLADPRFANAIEHYLSQEDQHMAAYMGELEAHAPFRSTPS